MYQALYRKYRPNTFSDVVGQEHITEILKNELKSGKIFHAYLFTGPRGTGKTSCAKILAKAINCLSPVDGDVCGKCELCLAAANGELLDITEIDAASNNGVDNIRDLKEQVSFTPAMSKYRVYIIDEVHMLSIGAFNALLKTLEEPPAHVVFILATTEVHKLPSTILSRCQRFDFHRIAPEKIAGRILEVAKNEGFTVSERAAELIASLSDGGMRDALSTLDLCAARSKDITEDDVLQVCSLAGSDYCSELAGMIRGGDVGAALLKIDELYKNAVDLSRLCFELIEHYRDLMIAKTVNDPKRLIICSDEQLEAVKAQAKDYPLEGITHAISVLSASLDRMSYADRRTEFETAVIKLCTPSLDASPEALLDRLERIERQIKYGGIRTSSAPDTGTSVTDETEDAQSTAEEIPSAFEPETEEAPPVTESEAPAKRPATPSPSAASLSENASLFEAWQDVIEELCNSAPLMAAALNGSSAYESGDFLLIDCSSTQFFSLIKSDPIYKQQIRNALQTVVGRSFKLGPYKKTAVAKDPLDDVLSRLKQHGIPEN